MEVPYLSLSAIWCLDDHVSVIDQVEVSVFWHLRNNVEVFFNNDIESIVQFTLLWLLVIINKHNFPLLSNVITSITNLDVSVFVVSVDTLVLYFKDLTFLIDNESSFGSKELPPS
jgi:hypothetical protein